MSLRSIANLRFTQVFEEDRLVVHRRTDGSELRWKILKMARQCVLSSLIDFVVLFVCCICRKPTPSQRQVR